MGNTGIINFAVEDLDQDTLHFTGNSCTSMLHSLLSFTLGPNFSLVKLGTADWLPLTLALFAFQFGLNFFHVEGFNHVAYQEIVIAFDAKAAFVALLDFLHVILETTQ